jgi:HD-GYP domain-containing protein (c-di-GMP phosphodiesterase class II)
LGESNLRAYVGVLAALAVTLVASWIYWYSATIELRVIVGVVIFAGLLLLADLFPIRVSERYDISTVEIGLLAAVVMLGPVWAALSALPYAVLGGRRDYLRTAYEASCVTVEACSAGIVFSFAAGPLLFGRPDTIASVVYAVLASGVTMVAVNHALNMILMKVKYRRRFEESWKELVQPYLLPHVISVLTVGVGVLVFLRSGPIAAFVVITGSIVSQVLVYRSREQEKENYELQTRVEALESALATSNNTFGTMIVRDLGRKDGYTHRHAAATAVYAADLAREMKLDEMRAEQLRMAGLLHNIGLFGLPEELLLVTGKLNSLAQSQLAEHPARGEEALAAVPEFEEMASWVRWHHERPDGRGYPDKLRGAWIPLEAKILAVAQAYAAMVLDQPRRPGMNFVEAREKLGAGIDTEFDGIVVRALLRILETESEGYRMADDNRFVFPAPEHRNRARPVSPEPSSDAIEEVARGFPR